jgi:hypothetical protein
LYQRSSKPSEACKERVGSPPSLDYPIERIAEPKEANTPPCCPPTREDRKREWVDALEKTPDNFAVFLNERTPYTAGDVAPPEDRPTE